VELRQNTQPAAADQIREPVPVAGEAKEPVLFGHTLGRRFVLWAEAGHELVRLIELLAADAVEALVHAAVKIARGLTCAPQPVDGRPVAGICAGAYEVVECELEGALQVGEAGGVAPHKLGGGDTGRLRRQHVLERVVVRPGQQPDLVAAKPAVASQ